MRFDMRSRAIRDGARDTNTPTAMTTGMIHADVCIVQAIGGAMGYAGAIRNRADGLRSTIASATAVGITNGMRFVTEEYAPPATLPVRRRRTTARPIASR